MVSYTLYFSLLVRFNSQSTALLFAGGPVSSVFCQRCTLTVCNCSDFCFSKKLISESVPTETVYPEFFFKGNFFILTVRGRLASCALFRVGICFDSVYMVCLRVLAGREGYNLENWVVPVENRGIRANLQW
jgi:hypothetical protein